MIKAKIISATTAVLGTIMIVIALVLQSNAPGAKILSNETNKINVINMSSSNRIVKTKIESTPVLNNTVIQELSMEQAPQAEYIPPRVEVYENMTIEELAAKLNRSLGTGYIAGKGNVIASKCIELGVDPYLATAIMLHETGCRSNCSSLVRTCNNVGGQKGAPGCNGGSYKSYATIDDGIVGHIENLYNRYYLKGYNTVESIGPRYAQSNTWIPKINWYINLIRTS